ncbi:ATP-binding protein [Streptomyces sp. NPDC096323]|uniref:ATP-binding protein n=1 Tax=Streptomyces sp. NPDC096323 TaxID=3155822 RepID=UPI003331870E
MTISMEPVPSPWHQPSTDNCSTHLPLSGCLRGAAAARRHVAEALGDWDVAEPVIEGALLVTSELVTNAERHTPDGPIELWVALQGTSVLVAVRDGRRTPLPPPRTAADDEEDGRGLQIIRALADSFGCSPAHAGKIVWAWITG